MDNPSSYSVDGLKAWYRTFLNGEVCISRRPAVLATRLARFLITNYTHCRITLQGVRDKYENRLRQCIDEERFRLVVNVNDIRSSDRRFTAE